MKKPDEISPGFVCLACVAARIANPATALEVFRARRAALLVPLAALRAALAFILICLTVAVAVPVIVFGTGAIVLAARSVALISVTLITIALVPVAITALPAAIIRSAALARIT